MGPIKTNLSGTLERAKGFEPSTSTLARLRSTPELRPQYLATITKDCACHYLLICKKLLNIY